MTRTKPTTLLQIFCEVMSNSKYIFKSIIDPDDTDTNISRHEWVKIWIGKCKSTYHSHHFIWYASIPNFKDIHFLDAVIK